MIATGYAGDNANDDKPMLKIPTCVIRRQRAQRQRQGRDFHANTRRRRGAPTPFWLRSSGSTRPRSRLTASAEWGSPISGSILPFVVGEREVTVGSLHYRSGGRT